METDNKNQISGSCTNAKLNLGRYHPMVQLMKDKIGVLLVDSHSNVDRKITWVKLLNICATDKFREPEIFILPNH
jgi:hypothetical protein